MSVELLNLFNDIDNIYYLESFGFNNDVPVYRNFTHLNAKVFFNILDKCDLEYYVFAGTSVGYIRNKKNIPWVDDYDIIVFEEDIHKFENVVLPKLKECGFSHDFPMPYSKQCNVGYHIMSKFGQKCFQCDVFYTKVTSEGIIQNTGIHWGLYNTKKIHIDMVKPSKYLTIDDDLTLPFFNEMEKDVEIEYGDVYNNVVLNINHRKGFFINEEFNKIYKCFNDIKCEIIDKTSDLFKNHKYNENITLENYDDFFLDFKYEDLYNRSIVFMKYIYTRNAKHLYILDQRFLIFCVDLKFYFNNIKISFYVTCKLENKNEILLNYVDNVFYSNKDYINTDNFNLFFLQKLNINKIKVITFGTYDLFHIGHTNILKRSIEYGDLVVGVSTDELNSKKGKISINNLEKRKSDVYNSTYAIEIFDEERLELKNEYIKKYKCNLLIMGDDWKNAFNECDCACLYLPRTPGISTTMLKEKMKLNETNETI